MSSPIHHSHDLDPALRYAPRRVREQASRTGRPLPLPPEFRRPMEHAPPEFSGDRAMVELQRQLLLDPDAIPEPLVDDARTLKPIVLRLSGVLALAALIAWCIVALPNMNRSYTPLPVRVAWIFENRVVEVVASTVSISVSAVPAVTWLGAELLPRATALASGV